MAARGERLRFRRWLESSTPLDWALRLSLLDLLLQPIGEWFLRPIFLGAAAAGLLVPGLLRRSGLWLLLAGLAGLRVALDWPLADNHAYLLAYWFLAAGLALRSDAPESALAWNARWMIGLVFALATLWKLTLSPDYLDGTFFRVSLLLDPRFEALTRALSGLDAATLEGYRHALSAHVDGFGAPGVSVPALPAALDSFARIATAATGAIEAAVAIAFLWPLGRGPSRARDALLLGFAATTYAVATVEGFAWLLLAMGIAQCESDRHRTRLAYLGVYALVLVYRELPW